MFYDRVRMPFHFDAYALAADVQALPDAAWQPHFNTAYYEGDWSGVALRSTGGRASLYADPHAEAGFADTPLLHECPSVRHVLSILQCDVTAVRFLRVGAASRVREHRDYGLDLETGEARLHVAVIEGQAQFVLDGKVLEMRPGECWYVDVSRPHSITNSGQVPRVHLVIDCMVNDWFKGLLANAGC